MFLPAAFAGSPLAAFTVADIAAVIADPGIVHEMVAFIQNLCKSVYRLYQCISRSTKWAKASFLSFPSVSSIWYYACGAGYDTVKILNCIILWCQLSWQGDNSGMQKVFSTISSIQCVIMGTECALTVA